MSVLFINACVRENSRTLVLAKKILSDISGEITEVNLNRENLAPLKRELLEKRENLIKSENMNDPIFDHARQFANADEIVIAAPFWDLSFPAILKAYMERISYDGLEAQKMTHQAFIDKLDEIDLFSVDENQQEALEELIGFLLNWLVNHILKMDKKIPCENE